MSQTHEEILWENRQEYIDLSLKIKSQLRYDEKNLTECFQVVNYFLSPNDDSRKDIIKYGAELSDLQRYEELYNELIDLLWHKKMEGFVDVKELSKQFDTTR